MKRKKSIHSHMPPTGNDHGKACLTNARIKGTFDPFKSTLTFNM